MSVISAEQELQNQIDAVTHCARCLDEAYRERLAEASVLIKSLADCLRRNGWGPEQGELLEQVRQFQEAESRL
jgi:hypothetical protein